MVHIFDLHDDLLTTILIFLVSACDGAADLSRLSATCTKFMSLAKESIILKDVNFHRISFGDYENHHHVKDLLVLCARAGNIAAETRLAKALLHDDCFFWSLIWKDEEPLHVANPQASDILHHQKLVRTFIRYASDKVLSIMKIPLSRYTCWLLGPDEAYRCGTLFRSFHHVQMSKWERFASMGHNVQQNPDLKIIYPIVFEGSSNKGSSHQEKMSPFYNLPDELLIIVITMLVTSWDGAADLVRLSATCRKFRALAEKSAILKVVIFDGITFRDFEAHHHVKDLLLLCARAGNVAAESRVAKALLHHDCFFWTIILDNDQPLFAANPQATGLLCHRKLVKSFIRHADYEEMSTMRFRLFGYTITFGGYKEAKESGILLAITDMTDYHRSVRDVLMDVFEVQENENVENERVVSIMPPENFEQNRARVLTIYDQLFP